MNCPVCPRTDIAADVLACPNCGVDLRPLLRLRELPSYRQHQAAMHLAEGRPEEAVGKLKAALEEGAAAAPTRLLLGKAWMKLGNMEQAARELDVAARDPQFATEAGELLRECGEKLRESGLAPSTTTVAPTRPEPARVVPLWVAIALVATNLLLLVVFGVRSSRESAAVAATGPESPTLQPATRTAPAATDSARPSATVERPTARRPETASTELVRALDAVPGIRVEKTTQGVEVVFLQELFDGNSSELNRNSRNRLAAVAAALATVEVPLSARVRGFTAPSTTGSEGDTDDAWRLGFRRASAAVLELYSTARPVVTWRAVGADQAMPPFMTEAEREKNRTVVLEFSPVPDGS